jgi:response regulator NasT
MSLSFKRHALLIGSEKVADSVGALLGGSFEKTVDSCGSDARRRLLTQDHYDLAILKAPLPDEYGDELSVLLSEKGLAVLFLVRAEQYEEMSQRLAPYGVITLSVPLVRSLFTQSVSLALATSARLLSLQVENEKLRRKNEEMQTVCRAKCLLVQHEQMTESEAHRYLEKSAMDLRLSRRELAALLIARYEE